MKSKTKGFVALPLVWIVVAGFLGAATVANTAACADKAKAPASCPK